MGQGRGSNSNPEQLATIDNQVANVACYVIQGIFFCVPGSVIPEFAESL